MSLETEPIIINFGKHKGLNILDVPKSYLEWIYKTNKDKHVSPYMQKIMDYVDKNLFNKTKEQIIDCEVCLRKKLYEDGLVK